MEEKVSVAAIKNGTVIDHIPTQQALKIVSLLNLAEEDNLVTIGLRLPSKTRGFKDLIKVENRFLTEKEAHDIAVFAPDATINIIRNYRVEKKIKAHLPKVIQKILQCPNRRCITHAERIDTAFFVEVHKQIIFLTCKYCEKIFERDLVK